MSEQIYSRSRAVSTARRIISHARRAVPVVDRVLSSRSLAERRQAMEGYVVCFELGEATIVAEGGAFAFQVPDHELRLGQQVRFVRRGERFEIV